MAAQRNFPRRTVEQALRIPQALKEYNGGNPWSSGEVGKAIGTGAKSSNFFYISTASRDYGLTLGTRDTAEISLTELGRRAVYPQSGGEQQQARLEAFLKVDLFRQVLEHYGGENLPDPPFLTNTLQQTFGIPPEFQDEFVDLFRKNCRFLGIGAQFPSAGSAASLLPAGGTAPAVAEAAITVATPDDAAAETPVCFIIMPFVERDDRHQTGFFREVLGEVFTPAAKAAGFTVKTARRQGSDVIQHTIVNDLLGANLVLADLTEHNPNVLFELGMRMNADLPVALVRARGTGPIFDVDNMLRVAEYDPNLWPTTVKADIPVLTDHIKGAWANRDSNDTFMKILRRTTPPAS
jgi:hypothetical protein